MKRQIEKKHKSYSIRICNNQYIEFKEETIEKYEARLEEKLGEEILIEVMINKN